MTLMYPMVELGRAVVKAGGVANLPRETREFKRLSFIQNIYVELLKHNSQVLEVRKEGDNYIVEVGKYLHSQSVSVTYTLSPSEFDYE